MRFSTSSRIAQIFIFATNLYLFGAIFVTISISFSLFARFARVLTQTALYRRTRELPRFRTSPRLDSRRHELNRHQRLDVGETVLQYSIPARIGRRRQSPPSTLCELHSAVQPPPACSPWQNSSSLVSALRMRLASDDSISSRAK